jgi:hypothetical protein
MELLGELDARLSAADDQHPARGKLVGSAVLLGVHHQDLVRERLGGQRPVRALVGAGADDDDVRLVGSGARLEAKACAAAGGQPGHAYAALDRPGVRRHALEVGDDLVPGDVALRVVAGVGVARQVESPVRRDEREAVPSSAPRGSDVGGLEDDVLDPRQSQRSAH